MREFAKESESKMPLPSGPNIPTNSKLVYIGLMTKGPRFEETNGDAALMQQHLAFLRAQVEAGHYKIFGPTLDDGDVRALVIMQAASLEEAQQISSTDPILKSCRLAIEIHPAFLQDVSGIKTEYSNAWETSSVAG
jgi:uncharacterized protein YciI